jgi:GNAT superfamily N-acetyltransferase
MTAPPTASESAMTRSFIDDTNEDVFELRLADKVIGFATVIGRRDEYWIAEIWVDGAHQGNGHARRLLATVLATYEGSDFALSCGAFDAGLSDSALAAWYGRHGFRFDDRPGCERRRMYRPACG